MIKQTLRIPTIVREPTTTTSFGCRTRDHARIEWPLFFGNVCDVHSHRSTKYCVCSVHISCTFWLFTRLEARWCGVHDHMHLAGPCFIIYSNLDFERNSCLGWFGNECFAARLDLAWLRSLWSDAIYTHTHLAEALYDHLFGYFIALHT